MTAAFDLSDTFGGAPTLVHGGITLAVLGEAQASRLAGGAIEGWNRRYVNG